MRLATRPTTRPAKACDNEEACDVDEACNNIEACENN